MRKPTGIILACGLILIGGLIAWAAVRAEHATKVTGGGWFISDTSSTEGHHCSFGIQAQGPMGGGTTWSGRGSFMDKDQRLKAILTVTDVFVQREADLLFLLGTAKVYVNNKSIGPYSFRLALVDDAVGTGNRADFNIFDLPYHSHGTLSGGQIKFH